MITIKDTDVGMELAEELRFEKVNETFFISQFECDVLKSNQQTLMFTRSQAEQLKEALTKALINVQC